MKTPFVQVIRIVVKADRLRCEVRLAPRCPRASSRALMAVLQQRHPQLPQHACKNEKGPLFGAVMNNTPLIHVLEHVAIDFMVQNNPCSNFLFTGTSQWIDQSRKTGCVELRFADDLCALAALSAAVEELNAALTQVLSP